MDRDGFKVRLTKDEVDLLKSFLPDLLKSPFVASLKATDSTEFEVVLDEDLADEIRDACGDELQVKGLGENYEPNEIGKVLETLIDKFFTG